jgi:hypothetical protein
MRYIHKPVEVEAVRYDGGIEPIRAWRKGGEECFPCGSLLAFFTPANGVRLTRPGEWIVREPDGATHILSDADFTERYALLPPAGTGG